MVGGEVDGERRPVVVEGAPAPGRHGGRGATTAQVEHVRARRPATPPRRRRRSPPVGVCRMRASDNGRGLLGRWPGTDLSEGDGPWDPRVSHPPGRSDGVQRPLPTGDRSPAGDGTPLVESGPLLHLYAAETGRAAGPAPGGDLHLRPRRPDDAGVAGRPLRRHAAVAVARAGPTSGRPRRRVGGRRLGQHRVPLPRNPPAAGPRGGRDPDEPGPWQVERLTWTILEAADEDGADTSRRP